MKDSNVEIQLRNLQQVFVSKLHLKLNLVQDYWAAVQSAANPVERKKSLTDLLQLVHSLAGSGASFGFPATSNTAAAVDSEIQEVLRQPSHFTSEKAAEINALIDRMRHAVQSELKANESGHFYG